MYLASLEYLSCCILFGCAVPNVLRDALKMQFRSFRKKVLSGCTCVVPRALCFCAPVLPVLALSFLLIKRKLSYSTGKVAALSSALEPFSLSPDFFLL